MKKRIISIILVCCMALLTMPFATYAALPETVEPLWDNTNIFTATLSFNGTRGTATVYVDGQSGVTDITLEIKLYYKNTSGSWIEVDKDWNYDVNSSTFAVSETFTGVSGREYKIVVKGTVTKAGYAETISKIATAMCK